MNSKNQKGNKSILTNSEKYLGIWLQANEFDNCEHRKRICSEKLNGLNTFLRKYLGVVVVDVRILFASSDTRGRRPLLMSYLFEPPLGSAASGGALCKLNKNIMWFCADISDLDIKILLNCVFCFKGIIYFTYLKIYSKPFPLSLV